MPEDPITLVIMFVAASVGGMVMFLGVHAVKLSATDWMYGINRGVVLAPWKIASLRSRHIPVRAVLDVLIAARRARAAVSTAQIVNAYLRGVDLQKVVTALGEAQRRMIDVDFEDLAAADLEERLNAAV